MTDTATRAGRRAGAPALRRAVAFEAALWRSLLAWVRRRPPVVEPGGTAFGYAATVTPLFWVFIGVSAVEVPMLDVIIAHTVGWRWLRILALVVGVYGLFWMFGLLAAMRWHPHVVGPAGLRVRYGGSIDIRIPWEDVAEIRPRSRQLAASRTVQSEAGDAGVILSIVTGSQTSVDVVLRRPTSVLLPKGPSEPVTELRFHVDDPRALVALAHRHLDVA
ncbi:hypothetical protein GA0074692_3144 [Micromonospora pallida]|uniref:Low molecular weight protein antigen 6 PH domain-containing protein n=1 Tax=Micromonospora pallida TaxID=145854 RepID=A0A1C6SPW9_9ACTN|nr:PH domain-containing protein [Micromonospora pallida]SCL31601.1 hypothetical protein GA0074692_3144 [Micromonospora pallida]